MILSKSEGARDKKFKKAAKKNGMSKFGGISRIII